VSLKRRIIISLALAVGLTAASLLFRVNLPFTDDQSVPGTSRCYYNVLVVTTTVADCNADFIQVGFPFPVLVVSSSGGQATGQTASPFAAADLALAFIFSFGLTLLVGRTKSSRWFAQIPGYKKRRLAVGLLVATTLTLASLFYRAPFHQNELCIDYNCKEINSPTNLNATGLGWPLRYLTLDNGDINLATLDPHGLGADFAIALAVGFGAAIVLVRRRP